MPIGLRRSGSYTVCRSRGIQRSKSRRRLQSMKSSFLTPTRASESLLTKRADILGEYGSYASPSLKGTYTPTLEPSDSDHIFNAYARMLHQLYPQSSPQGQSIPPPSKHISVQHRTSAAPENAAIIDLLPQRTNGKDSFVNSQEWTMSRTVPDLKLGVIGALTSGKTALVHRYLTGSYMQDESPEGGRFKKEVVIDGHSYLLLIRDEGGAPEHQFAHWADAVILVFSLENESSFNALYQYYAKLAHYRNTNIPLILVGTQDGISESRPRVIEDSRARELARDLKRCSYFETCATYGLNVDRVFREACSKIINSRQSSSLHHHQQQQATTIVPIPPPVASCPSTPSHQHHNHHHHPQQHRREPSLQAHYSQSSSTNTTNSTILPSHHHQQTQQSSNNNINLHINPSSSNNLRAQQQSPMSNNHHTQHGGSSAGGVFIVPSNPPQSSSSGYVGGISPRDGGGGGGTSASYHSTPNTPFAVTPSPSTHSVSCIQSHSHYHHPQQQQHYQQYQQQQQQQQTHHPNNHFNSNSSATTPLKFRDNESRTGGLDPRLPQSSNEAIENQLPTPTSTPTASRKNHTSRRISNIFRNPKENNENSEGKNGKNGVGGGGSVSGAGAESLGSGRAIPIKQGHLYKRTNKTLNSKEWKKKYVCLYSDGRLAYHSSLKDYMEDVQGKEIFLGLATVKIPQGSGGNGKQQKKQPITAAGVRSGAAGTQSQQNNPALSSKDSTLSDSSKNVQLRGYEVIPEGRLSMGPGAFDSPSNNGDNPSNNDNNPANTHLSLSASNNMPAKKKRHTRKGSGAKNADTEDYEDCELIIVSSDEKQWHLEASSIDERDEWVAAIQQQIGISLQGQLSNKRESHRVHGERSEVESIRSVSGNERCADCDAPQPDWASLNLGSLICIECSGIHRNLGAHISRVRSLDLDEWPVEYLLVMQGLGNDIVNNIWEYDTHGKTKPSPSDKRENKEKWIDMKYNRGEFRRPLPFPIATKSLHNQLIDAVISKDLELLICVLAECDNDEDAVNACLSVRDKRTPLHLASSVSSPTITQMLIWHGADIDAVDQEGRNAQWYAEQSGGGGGTICAQILANARLNNRPSSQNSHNIVNNSHHPNNPAPPSSVRQSLSSSVRQSLSKSSSTAGNRVVADNNDDRDFDKLPASII